MITEYQYWRNGKPIPKGWTLAASLKNCHHGHHCILIKKVKNMSNHPRRSIVKNWPKYLKAFRVKHKLTQRQLADKLQISCRVVENWEGGQNTPAAILKLALKYLEITL